MAAHYRKFMAEILREFDNSKHKDEFYNALAWEGLSEIKDLNGNKNKIFTEAWKEVPFSEQQKILKIITDHKRNGSKICN